MEGRQKQKKKSEKSGARGPEGRLGFGGGIVCVWGGRSCTVSHGRIASCSRKDAEKKRSDYEEENGRSCSFARASSLFFLSCAATYQTLL